MTRFDDAGRGVRRRFGARDEPRRGDGQTMQSPEEK
jgi:hypothetical protein